MPLINGRSLTGLVFGALLAGCATQPSGVIAPPPEAAGQLRMALATDADNPDLSWRLAASLRAGGETAEATQVVNRALTAAPAHPANLHMRAALLEETGQYAEAIAAYERFLAVDGSEPLAREAEKRITWLRRQLIESRVREALAQEAALSQGAATQGTLAIFPFSFVGSDATLGSLSRALSHMLATDMAATGRIDVLERVEVQLLADEIARTEAGYVDPATGIRGGRMLGAERVAQGQVGGDAARLLLSAALLETAAPEAAPTPVEVDEALDRFFEAEGALALGLFDAMGIELTAAERERVGRRRTENLQALLAFGTGLEAQDEGRFTDARLAFEQAVSLDPEFEDAVAALQEATDLEEAEQDDADEVAALGGDLLRPSAMELWLDRRGTYLPIERIIPDVGGRDPFEEIGPGEKIGPQSGTILIRIPRPGGGS